MRGIASFVIASGMLGLACSARAVCTSSGEVALHTNASDTTPCTLTVDHGNARVHVDVAGDPAPQSPFDDGGLSAPTPSCVVSVPQLTVTCRRDHGNVWVTFHDPSALKAYLGVEPDETFGTALHCGTEFSSGIGGLMCGL